MTADTKLQAKILRKALDVGFAIPPPLKVSEWADQYRYLSSEASSKPGKWTSWPFQREPMDAALDPTVSRVVLEWASQVCGKSEMLNNVVGYHIDREPCPILAVQPTVQLGETWSKDRLVPMLRDTPNLRGKVGTLKSRDGNQTISHKVFPGGHLSVSGANAPAGLSSRPIKILLCDEVDRYPDSAGKEGDPVALALKRTESFPDAICFLTSTPTIEGLSKIHKAFEGSDQRYFSVPCPCCAHFQHLVWKQVKWPEGKPEEAKYECENCNEKWTDEQRVAAIYDPRSHWNATAPFNGVRGYHLNGLYCLFKTPNSYKTRLHKFAADFLEANAKGDHTLKTWVNTFLAETWKERGDVMDHKELVARCENYPILPEKGLVILGAGDVQGDRIELEKKIYGKDEESWGIDYEILMGNPEFDTVWDALFNSIQKEYNHPCGKKLKPAAFFIDAGHLPRRVTAFVKRCQMRGLNVYACIGSRKPWDEKLLSRPAKSVKQRATMFSIGTDHGKVIVHERLKIKEPGPRYCHFPIGRGYDEEYFKQLVAEKLVLHFKNNILVAREWVKQRDRNEALDISYMILAALDSLSRSGVDWDTLAKNLAVTQKASSNKANELDKIEPSQNNPKSRNPAPSLRHSNKGGFVGRWRRV